MTKELLIIFVRKPELGKVKTRLAATIGKRQALKIYRQLLQHTHAITKPLTCDKLVYYAPDIQQGDLWDEGDFRKAQQTGGDLGERMMEAFRKEFEAGYERICIIGSDCYQLTTPILENAFELLHNHQLVIGPSQDGGYYLLGMRALQETLFKEKQWSTASVFNSTVSDAETKGLHYALLQELIDIDEEDDLKTMQ